MHEHFQAVLKRHLQAKVETHPPLFPWETELADYPDYPDASSMMQVRSAERSIKQSTFTSFLPVKIFNKPLVCQNIIGFYILLTVKLLQSLKISFPKATHNLKGKDSLVLKSLYWSVSLAKYFILLLFLLALPAKNQFRS
ncbi:hypothetical protein NIES4071_69330 [Calothrix sp. NIES-4071]|nr:hypothetical protein NIES4071_69330 [Calothrix sp. NIES-4071]BAZ61210.1 hypothetical protein NIES4105_69280 [Calothrix sp. NIES-4105]